MKTIAIIIGALLAVAVPAVAASVDQGSNAAKGAPAKQGPRGPRGARGPAGPAGQPGAQGPAGPSISRIITIDGPDVSIAPGSNSYRAQQQGQPSLQADCPAGTTAVGSGFDTGIGNQDFALKFGSFVAGFVDNDTSITIEASMQAICAAGATDSTPTRASRISDQERFQEAARQAAALAGGE